MPVAATVFLSESNGASPSVTDNVSNMNFGGVDLPNLVPANHPVIKPGASNARFNSYFKAFRLKIQSLGDSIQIQDLRQWKALGVYKAEESILWSTNGNNVYFQPNQLNLSATVGGEGNVPTANPGVANMFTKSPASVAPITAADGIPFYCPYIFFQWIGNNVGGGTTPIDAMNQKTFAFTYDES